MKDGDLTDSAVQTRYFPLQRHVPVSLCSTDDAAPRKSLGLVYEMSLDGMAVEVAREYRPDVMCTAEIYLLGGPQPARVSACVLDASECDEAHAWHVRLRFEKLSLGTREKIERFLEDEKTRRVGVTGRAVAEPCPFGDAASDPATLRTGGV